MVADHCTAFANVCSGRHKSRVRCPNPPSPHTPRQYIVQSVESCNDPQLAGCGSWVASLANLWRTGGDIQATWPSMLENIHANDKMAAIARPGKWNDPVRTHTRNVCITGERVIVTILRAYAASLC